MTVRDQAWDAVVQQLVETGKFKIGDLDLDDSQRHTVRRACLEMEELGWLRRTDEDSRIWRAGELAVLHLNLSEQALEQMDQ